MITQTHKSNIESSTFASSQFTIESNAYVFDLLTSKVYNDPITASMREVSTNAIDACIDAYKEVVFDVHLPTPEESFFSVRDYGTGMSPDTISGMYSTMGASSKRDSNDYNGCMGIGKLAPLSYAQSFTLTSYYQGTAYSYLVTTQDGIPAPISLGSIPTTEPDGITIQFQVEPADIHTFIEKAKQLYLFFNHKPNLNIELNITIPDSVKTSAEWYFAPDYTPNRYYNYVLMSNILYQIPSDSAIDRVFDGLILVCPTGSVSINPGRESISLDKNSINYINNRIEQVKTEYIQTMYDVFNEPTSQFEKIVAFNTLFTKASYSIRKNINSTHIKHNIPDLDLNIDSYNIFINSVPSFTKVKFKQPYYKSYQTNKTFYISDLAHTVYVADVTYRYAEQLPSNINYTIFTRPQGTKHESFVKSTTDWLDRLGVTYTLVSTITNKPDKQTTTIRDSGIYVHPLHNTSISTSYKATEDTYWYIPVSGTTHILDDSLVLAIYKAYQLITSNKTKLPRLVGVSKKYINDVESNPNFILATDVIQQELDKHKFISNRNHNLIISTYSMLDNPPPDIYQAYLYDASPHISDYSRDFAYISKHYSIKVIDHLTPFSTTQLDKRYPLFNELASHSRREHLLSHYMNLELAYDSTRITCRRITDDYVTYGPNNPYEV